VNGSNIFKLIACFLLVCALTRYTQTAEQTQGAIVFLIAIVIASLGHFAGEDL
jgi:hypothetical protein